MPAFLHGSPQSGSQGLSEIELQCEEVALFLHFTLTTIRENNLDNMRYFPWFNHLIKQLEERDET